jgi:hypothetical protein
MALELPSRPATQGAMAFALDIVAGFGQRRDRVSMPPLRPGSSGAHQRCEARQATFPLVLSLFLSPGRVGANPPPSSAPYRRRVASPCRGKIGIRLGWEGTMPQNPAIWRGGRARHRSRATRGEIARADCDL